MSLGETGGDVTSGVPNCAIPINEDRAKGDFHAYHVLYQFVRSNPALVKMVAAIESTLYAGSATESLRFYCNMPLLWAMIGVGCHRWRHA